MKRFISLITNVLIFGAAVFAQCPGAPITLSTQAQVNNFPTNYPGCSTITVSVTIQGNNIANLNGLSGVTSITKSLFIQNNPALTSLSGLSNLSNIGVELTIDNNDALTNLTGLNNLPFIGGSLDISNNALLNNLSALSGVAYINGYLGVSFNPALTSLNGLNNVATIGRYLQINNNNALTSLNSLNNLTGVGINAAVTGRYLSIGSNPNMTTLNGLNSLVSVGAQVDIANNGAMTTFGGLTNLSTINGYLSITNNSHLTNLSPLANITYIGGNLTIASNVALTNCAAQGICDYLDNPTGSISISNNATGCNTVVQVQNACALLPVELTVFEGRQVSDGILLNWQTDSEQDDDYFEVEHSTNGTRFEALGTVAGNGTTQSVNRYNFEDFKPSTGPNYYRLKQVDADGKYNYSNIIDVYLKTAEVEIYPNPTDGIVAVAGSDHLLRARIFDGTGKFLWENVLTESPSIDLSDRPEGIYFIEIQMENGEIMQKVIRK